MTPAAAAVGSVLNIKPVLQIQGDKLDAFKKVRGWKAAKKAMIAALHEEIEGRFAGKKLWLGTAYSGDKAAGEAWHQTVCEEFLGYEVIGGCSSSEYCSSIQVRVHLASDVLQSYMIKNRAVHFAGMLKTVC